MFLNHAKAWPGNKKLAPMNYIFSGGHFVLLDNVVIDLQGESRVTLQMIEEMFNAAQMLYN